MASSNLKSLVIKQDRNLTEIITDGNFRLLYNAIKEIVTYWSDLTITQSQKNAYLNKYGLTKFIDITGTIKVNNVYWYQKLLMWIGSISLILLMLYLYKKFKLK